MPKLRKKDAAQEEVVVLPVKDPESMMPHAATLAAPSAMGMLHELTPITLGRSNRFPCRKKSSLHGHIVLSVS